MCKVLVQLLDSFLQQNMTVSAVEKVLNVACDALIPAPEKAPVCSGSNPLLVWLFDNYLEFY